MGQSNRFNFKPFISLIVILIVGQFILISVDRRQSATRVAKAFIESYYYLDPAMQNFLCAQNTDSGQAVATYLQRVADEAALRGYDINYMRRMFTKIHLKPIAQDEKSARIHISGNTRTAINPAFMLIGDLFNIGSDYPVDATLELVNENGQWRVCDMAL